MNLEHSIEHLYLVFSNVQPPKKILNFECINCISKEDENYLLKTPLRDLNDHIFGRIFEACNVIEFGNEDYKYYIPRILELTTIENSDFSFSFVEYTYRDFAKFDYLNKFNNKEIKVIDDFFFSFMEREFSKSENERDESEIFNVAETGFNPSMILTKISKQKEWFEIKSQIEYHLKLQKNWAKSEQEFEEWIRKGTRNKVIEFLNNEK